MRNGLSICQTKYCETMFLALPRIAYIIFNRQVVVKTTLCQKLPQTIITELQLNLQKHFNICCCSFNKINEEKNCAAR